MYLRSCCLACIIVLYYSCSAPCILPKSRTPTRADNLILVVDLERRFRQMLGSGRFAQNVIKTMRRLWFVNNRMFNVRQ